MSDPGLLTDQRSRDRIVGELDRNMLVEAGAGSGKTYMMAARMAAGIASGAYTVEHMAAVTFTRKAAAELRGRFQLALEDSLAKTSDTDRGARLRAALSNLERFFAGTIHSFCAHLLRERPVEAGISPGFVELDDVQDLTRRRQSWRDYRTEAKAAGDGDILALIEAGLEPKYLDDAFGKVCMYAEVDFPAGDAPCPNPEKAWAELDQFWLRLQGKLLRPIDSKTTCDTQKRMRHFERRLRVADRDPTRACPEQSRGARTLVELLDIWDFKPGITQSRWSDDPATKKRLNQEIPSLHVDFQARVVNPFLLAWRQYVYRLSVPVLMKAREKATADRRRDNILNYGDLLQLTARVLRDNADVRRALRDKYRWVFVDEFQDTDPVQAEIIFALTGDRPGSLFVVGDPKQSIYRFTRADIAIYSSARKQIEDDGGNVLPLTTNFRSVPALCDWANGVFKPMFPEEPTVYSPKFASLDPQRGPGSPGTGVFTLTIPAAVKQSDVPHEEADRIARFIRSEVDANRRQFGDFLILTRKKSDRLKPYAEALEALQIPIEVSGAGAFGESIEVASLALVLRALADPQDSVSLIGVLRGPLFGLSDSELFAYQQTGGWFNIFSDASPTEAGPARVAAAIGSLREMFRLTRIMPTGAALERILERTGYLALAATSPGGVEAGDLFHAIDRVRAVVESGYSLLDAAEALEADADESSEVESLPLEPGRPAVVRLMNLHKAKGLEAPVVFLADPCGGFKPRVDVRIIREGTDARGYLLITRGKGDHGKETVAEPVGWAAHEAEERHYLDAEGQRLLYVAATRARDALVVGRWAKAGGATRAWGEFDLHLAKAPELAVPATVALPPAETIDLSSAVAAKAMATRDSAHENVRRPSWSAASVTGEAHHIVRVTAVAEFAPDDPTRAIAADTPSRRADAGVAWGTLIHGLLEHAMRHSSATRSDLRRLAMWLTVEEPQLRVVIDEALDTVQAVVGAGFWSEARGASACHEETPFSVRDGGGVVPKVLSGTMDLVYRTLEGWRIVDYKTDADGSVADLRARYAEQVRLYEEAWERFVTTPIVTQIISARVRG